MANQVTSSTDTATQVLERDDFSALLSKEFKPKTDQAREAVVAAVRTLAEQALVNTSVVSHEIGRASCRERV